MSLACGRRHLEAFAVALVAVACTPTPPDDRSGLDLALDALSDVVTAECEWRFACCDGGEIHWTFGPSVDSVLACEQHIIASVSAGSTWTTGNDVISQSLELAAHLEAGRIEPREEAIADCAELRRAQPCNAWSEPSADARCVPGDVVPHDPCAVALLFDGLVPPGGECPGGSDYVCAEGHCVAILGTFICTRDADDDEPCGRDADCAAGLSCDPVEGRCRVGAQLGETCAYFDPSDPVPGTELIACAQGLECDPVAARCVGPCSEGSSCGQDGQCPDGRVCLSGRCRLPGPEGDPCTRDQECSSEVCDFGTGSCLEPRAVGELCNDNRYCRSGYCDFTQNSCAPLVDAGAPCDPANPSMCGPANAHSCEYDPDAAIYACVDRIEVGAPCDPNASMCVITDPEGEPVACNGETCARYPFEDGAACSGDSWCVSGVCFEGYCQSGAPEGSLCDDLPSTLPCASDLYCARFDGELRGYCLRRTGTGAPCSEDEACWGSCTPRWASLVCDPTYPPATQAVMCDGPGDSDFPFE